MLYNINVALEKMKNAVDVPDSDKKVSEGQFKFLRAYYYFQLTHYYDDVILILKISAKDYLRKPLQPSMRLEPSCGVNDQENPSLPKEDWNLSGAMYAYIFLQLTHMGIDVAGESQLVDYPSQFPDISMVNRQNGNPNARYRILKLRKENFGAGDKLVSTNLNGGNLLTQTFTTQNGKKSY